jgi:hypothetical protein
VEPFIDFFLIQWKQIWQSTMATSLFTRLITVNATASGASKRLFSSTVAPHAYYTSSLVSDTVVKKVDPSAKLYDFRSDTVTAPTDEMFDLMKSASRSDDVFQVSSTSKQMKTTSY